MKFKIIKKIIIYLIIIILFFNFSNPSALNISTNNTKLFVGGDGIGNYSKIQEAINDALEGYIIFVYEGTYYENICIDKSIKLIGQNKYNTIIDGSNNNHVIIINKNRINVTGFTIQNAGIGNSGIILTNNATNNEISGNIIRSNIWIGINFDNSNHNLVINNLITDNSDGISLSYKSSNNTFLRNNIENNEFYGIFILYSNDNVFYYNNIFENGQNAHDNGVNIWDNDWHGNYWGDYVAKYPDSRKIFLKGIWNVPYQISGEINQDRYPLYKKYEATTINIQMKSIFCLNIFEKLINYIWWNNNE